MASLHTEEGSRLLEHWSPAEELCTIVRHHHDEFPDTRDTLTGAARLTDRVCNARGIGIEPGVADPAESDEARLLGVPAQGIEALGRCAEAALEVALR